jgi:hypothetical protein
MIWIFKGVASIEAEAIASVKKKKWINTTS